MIRAITRIFTACCGLMLGAYAIAAEAPQIKVGTLKFGTVNWELKVIADGLDEQHGFALTRVDFADKDATSIALQSGEVD
ncbi:MAG TPA: ABC transporter substrate-binding protein, partial [Dongiaceae bacterium]|nr:ABC transporter substrate-binding protein [Dongiaceae bacterium]